MVGISTAGAAETTPSRYLNAFYAEESERVVDFNPAPPDDTPFDIIILHVCSMSWDDLKEIGVDNGSEFFGKFDYLFTISIQPPGIADRPCFRLLQANCDQKSHHDVHGKDIPKVCMLFNGLASSRYDTYASMSHNGEYGYFITAVKPEFKQ